MSGDSSLGAALLAATLAAPLALLLACLSQRLRSHAPALLVLAPIPGLAAALLAIGGTPLAFDVPRLRISLALDVPGAMLLGVAALLWSAAGIYAFTSLRGQTTSARFTVCWLLTLTGSLGVFIVADLLGFYLVFALVSLPAWGLIVHADGDAGVQRAGGVYMAFTILSEALLLLGFVLLAAGEPEGSLQIRAVVAALPHSPWRDAALAFTAAGFALKIGSVPVHGWMPLTYAAAPIPAAAVLSGAAVKAGVIGLIRFLPFDHAMASAGEVLVAVGLFSAFYGVAIGITQNNPKTVLAYSSISQMGVIAAVLGLGLTAGDGSAPLGAAFYAAHHVLVKGALFLAVGVVAATASRHARPTLVLAAVLALGLGGLPFTGGALAKLAVKPVLGDGLVGMLANLSAAGTTLLMLHFLHCLAQTAPKEPQDAAPAGFTLPWQAMALASLVVPWLLYGGTTVGKVAEIFTLQALIDTLWPVLLGGALALALRRWRPHLPSILPGDIVGSAESAFHASYALGAALERTDGLLRQWPAAGVSLLTIGIALGAAIFFGH